MAAIDYSELGDDYDPENIDQGGLPKPGKAHLLVASVEDKGDFLSVTQEIVAHEDETQVGKLSYNIFNKAGKGVKRTLLFALAIGITTKQALAEAKVAGTSVDLDFENQATSKSYIGELVASEYNGKKKCRVEWDFKPLNHPEAKDYPRNLEYAEALPDNEKAADESGDSDIPF